MRRSLASLAALALLLCGCQQYQLTLRPEGPVQDRTAGRSPINTFHAAFALAAKTAPDYDDSGAPTLGETVGDRANTVNSIYLSAGFTLADSNCLDYFRRAGKLQQAANVFKDISSAFVPIAAGALALAPNSARAGAILGLVGAANTAALDTVFTDFLFDASNIDDVQQLTMKAMATHEIQVLENTRKPGTALTFGWATQQIMQHQALCQPAHILFLVRQAIANGTVIAENTGERQQLRLDPALALLGGPLPPPPPMVEVRVVPSLPSPTQPIPTPTVVIQAKPDMNTAALRRCIWPTATRFDPVKGALTASGEPAPPNRSVAPPLLAWIKDRNLPSLAVLLLSPALASSRAEAVARFCTP